MAGNLQVSGVDFDNYYIPANSSVISYTDRTLWAWGGTNITPPSQVGVLASWETFSHTPGPMTTIGNVHYGVIKSNGTLWTYGGNLYGQLGQNNRTFTSSFVQVGTGNTWSTLSVGPYTVYSIKTDGTFWSWGYNNNGQLGDGTTTDRSSPVQIGALTNWSKVSAGGGAPSTLTSGILAVKTDGTLWSWGTNTDGQLGLGDTTNRSSPTQVGTGTTWSKIAAGKSYSLAIKTDGTLWSWGKNTDGQLGLGDRTHRSSPVQVGALTAWSLISAGSYHSLAIKTDGTLWSWGKNTTGRLGLGDLVHRSSPVQVGALTTWSILPERMSDYASACIKTDGTLWVWGGNGLGDETLIERSSPIWIGASTNWKSITLGFTTGGGQAFFGTRAGL